MASIINISEDKFQVIVSLGYRADGRKKRRKKTFILEKDKFKTEKSKEKEKKKIAENYEKQVKNQYYIKSDITFEEFSKIYMENYAKQELSATTYKRYETLLVKINEEIGDLKVNEIKPPHIKDFKRKVANFEKKVPVKDEKGKTIGYNKEKIAPKTQLHYFNLVSGILAYALEEDYILDNPCHKVKSPKVPKKESTFLDIDTIKQILKFLEEEPIQYRTFIELLIYTGIRRGERTSIIME